MMPGTSTITGVTTETGLAQQVQVGLCDKARSPSSDPTGTLKLRRAFAAAAKLRLRQLRATLRTSVIDHDVLGLGGGDSLMMYHARETRMAAFHEWVEFSARRYLTSDDWYVPFIERGWRSGATAAAGEVGGEALHGSAPPAYLVQLAAQELRGIAAAIVQQVARAAAPLTQACGHRARAYRLLARAMDRAGVERLVALANVSAVQAHNQAKLAAYRAAGIGAVGVIPELAPRRRVPVRDARRAGTYEEEPIEVGVRTAGDDKVCIMCEEYAAGAPYDIDEVEDALPLHPHCRCAWFPWDDRRFRHDADPFEEGKHPRGFHGKFAPGYLGRGYSVAARLDRRGVIHTPSVFDAQRALAEGREVELDQPRKVSVLVDRLGHDAAELIAQGEKAPDYNLCNVMIEGESLFCHENKDIPRIKMPQLDKRQTKEFRRWLQDKGYAVEKDTVRSDHLRATQNEISGVKTARIADKIRAHGGEIPKRLVVSRDDYVLDGHHHWAAKLGLDYADGKLRHDLPVKVARVDISITKLLKLANEFTGGKGAKGTGDAYEEGQHPRGYHGRWGQASNPRGFNTGDTVTRVDDPHHAGRVEAISWDGSVKVRWHGSRWLETTHPDDLVIVRKVREILVAPDPGPRTVAESPRRQLERWMYEQRRQQRGEDAMPAFEPERHPHGYHGHFAPTVKTRPRPGSRYHVGDPAKVVTGDPSTSSGIDADVWVRLLPAIRILKAGEDHRHQVDDILIGKRGEWHVDIAEAKEVTGPDPWSDMTHGHPELAAYERGFVDPRGLSFYRAELAPGDGGLPVDSAELAPRMSRDEDEEDLWTYWTGEDEDADAKLYQQKEPDDVRLQP